MCNGLRARLPHRNDIQSGEFDRRTTSAVRVSGSGHHAHHDVSLFGFVVNSYAGSCVCTNDASARRGALAMTDLIFVVEGEYGAGRLAKSSLEQAGYVVHTFSTATALIEKAKENMPSLVVVAGAFPDGGVDLCRPVPT